MEPYEKFVKNHETILVKLNFALIAEAAAGSACWLKYRKDFYVQYFFIRKIMYFLFKYIFIFIENITYFLQ